MPARIRQQLIDESQPGIYHCFVRCVRRAFVCGIDLVTGRDLSHRRDWIRDRLEALAGIFAIDVLTFAILENHYHTVLRNRPAIAKDWTSEEVITRWLQLCRWDLKLREPPSKKRIAKLLEEKELIAEWRRRLSSISWFMLMMNEPIARKANEEEKQSGHFWSERFGSSRLETDEAILACSLYVDLNEIRAQLADTPEESRYTSAFARIADWMTELAAAGKTPGEKVRELLGVPLKSDEFDPKVLQVKLHSGWMAPIHESGDGYAGAKAKRRASDMGFLPIKPLRYLELLDTFGRDPAPGKRGQIPTDLPPILERLKLNPLEWEVAVKATLERFARIHEKAFASLDERRRAGPPRVVQPLEGGTVAS